MFQARVLEWVAISFSRGSSWPRDWTQVSCIADRRFTIGATREANSTYRVHIISVVLNIFKLSTISQGCDCVFVCVMHVWVCMHIKHIYCRPFLRFCHHWRRCEITGKINYPVNIYFFLNILFMVVIQTRNLSRNEIEIFLNWRGKARQSNQESKLSFMVWCTQHTERNPKRHSSIC